MLFFRQTCRLAHDYIAKERSDVEGDTNHCIIPEYTDNLVKIVVKRKRIRCSILYAIPKVSTFAHSL